MSLCSDHTPVHPNHCLSVHGCLTNTNHMEHPSNSLRVGTREETAALAKVNPVHMPNETLVRNLQQKYPSEPRWRSFRNSPQYIFVMNWMHQCRGYLRMQSELFDCDLFEIELFSLVSPPPVDDMVLLVNKVKLALISKIHGRKVASLAMFEPLVREYFGNATALGRNEKEEDAVGGMDNGVDGMDNGVDSMNNGMNTRENDILFDSLFIDDKIQTLYVLMEEVTHYADFKEYLVKNNLPADVLRSTAIYEVPSKKNPAMGESYHLLFDNTALYRKTVCVPELSVPKKRTLAPEDPDTAYPGRFDVVSVNYELIYNDLYGFDAYVAQLSKNKKLKENKTILEVLKQPSFVSNIFSSELRKRKFLMSRKRDLEMTRLLATRKRSSRIEAKEKQKTLEEKHRQELEKDDMRLARSRRSERAMSARMRMDYTAGLSREERLNQRKSHVTDDDIDVTQNESNDVDDIVEVGDVIDDVESGNLKEET